MVLQPLKLRSGKSVVFFKARALNAESDSRMVAMAQQVQFQVKRNNSNDLKKKLDMDICNVICCAKPRLGRPVGKIDFGPNDLHKFNMPSQGLQHANTHCIYALHSVEWQKQSYRTFSNVRIPFSSYGRASQQHQPLLHAPPSRSGSDPYCAAGTSWHRQRILLGRACTLC